MKKDRKQLVKDAMLKRATGYDATETVEEYVERDGEICLVKRKVSTKNVPPDVSAARLVMEEGNESLTELSDEQLLAEKQRLMDLLKRSK